LVALYITSLEKGSGKTAICAGLIKHLLDDGKKTGFSKPVVTGSKGSSNEATDNDAAFIKRLFALKEPADLLSPAFSDDNALKNGIKGVYTKLSQDKDVVIVEGATDQSQSSRDIAETLDARVIIVESYSQEPFKAADHYKDFGKRLLGVVFNKVPGNRIDSLRAEASARLDKTGVNILGVLPEDRALLALTVGELAEHIQGEMFSGAEEAAGLVENVMIGAMSIDSGLDYFGRKDNKAVVVKGERPDMQLAALETSTSCLILTGGEEPKPAVAYQAEEKSIPIIITKDDTITTIKTIEDTPGEIRFSQDSKLARITGLMERNFDFKAVYKGLGLAG